MKEAINQLANIIEEQDKQIKSLQNEIKLIIDYLNRHGIILNFRSEEIKSRLDKNELTKGE